MTRLWVETGPGVQRKSAIRWLGLLLVAVVGSASAAASSKHAHVHKRHHAPASATTQPAIIWRGDHCTARVFKGLIKAFDKLDHARVVLQPFSTISGLDAVHAGTADVAGSARAAMPGRAEEQGTNFYPVAWDALVPIVSVDNPLSNISLKQLHDLYMGDITNWQQLGGEDAPINLYAVAAPLDGIEYSYRALLFHYGDTKVAASRLYINTVQLEAAVVIDPHGIGMTTLSGAAGNPKLKMLSVDNVAASDTSITDGTYPLYTALYLATRNDDPHHAEVAKFIAFSGSADAAPILREHHLVPYSDAPGLIGMQDKRAEYVYAKVHAPTPAPVPSVTAPAETPVSAPNATAESLIERAPTSELTAKAKARAARARAARAAKKAHQSNPKGADVGDP